VFPRPTLRDRILLRLQRYTSFLFFPLLATATGLWVRWIRKLSLADTEEVRARFKRLVREDSSPVLLCANHLTLVDSIVLAWALVPTSDYLRNYSLFPWSVPERANFSGTVFWRVVSFLGKCVYVTRGGPRAEVNRTLGKIAYLLRSGELVSVFPEGGRSRTGRVDTENFAYGVGQVVLGVPGTRVLCAYMRGRDQETYSDFPRKGDVYGIDLDVIRPETTFTGLRGARDLATQIIQKLAAMEEDHLAHRERSRRSGNP
jgi:1-acyl-sn-glycerol-3-phosphate acyltransferase